MANIFETVSKKGSIEILSLLSENKKSFLELNENIKISSKTLVERLKELVNAGLIIRDLKENRRVFYSISDKGKIILEKIEDFERI